MKSGCSVVTNTAARHSGMPASSMRRQSSVSTSSECCEDLAPSSSHSTTVWMALMELRFVLARLHASRFFHLGPARDIVGDIFGEGVRRHLWLRFGAEVGQPLLDRLIVE